MENLSKYWWVLAVAFVGFILLRQSSGGGSQIVQSGPDPNAVLQTAAAERQADEQNRLSTVAALLSYLQLSEDRQQEITLAEMSNSTNLQVANLAASSQNAAYSAQLQQQQIAANLQAQALAYQYQIAKKQKNSQNLSTILNGILGGLSIFQSSNSGGGGGLFGSGVGGWVIPTF